MCHCIGYGTNVAWRSYFVFIIGFVQQSTSAAASFGLLATRCQLRSYHVCCRWMSCLELTARFRVTLSAQACYQKSLKCVHCPSVLQPRTAPSSAIPVKHALTRAQTVIAGPACLRTEAWMFICQRMSSTSDVAVCVDFVRWCLRFPYYMSLGN